MKKNKYENARYEISYYYDFDTRVYKCRISVMIPCCSYGDIIEIYRNGQIEFMGEKLNRGWGNVMDGYRVREIYLSSETLSELKKLVNDKIDKIEKILKDVVKENLRIIRELPNEIKGEIKIF